MKSVIGVILLVIWQASSTPMENSFDGYDYTQPPCPLLYPSTITSFVPQLHFVTENFTKTETIVTVLKPSTIKITTTVPTTITDTKTDTIIRTETDVQISTSRITETLPPVTTISSTTKWRTTSYPVTTTETTILTDFRTETSTRFTTVTETKRSTIPVTSTVTTTVCTPNNAYLPARNDPTCVPPPQTYLPVDILPPIAPASIMAPSVPAECPETVTSTATTTIYRDGPIKTVTLTPPSRSAVAAALENGSTKYVMKDVVTVTKSLTRTSSVILYDQLVTKRVSVTPTLTSYIYLDPVTKTVPARRSPNAVLG